MSRRQAVVAIPVYKPAIDEMERFSLARCRSVLGTHPIVWICPLGLDMAPYVEALPEARIMRFDDRYFRSLDGYSELLVTPHFYESFLDYEYLLIYQPDAFVFEDRLHYWCERGFDYIGAPWIDEKGRWTGVGNGGFCLRRIDACLSVLRNNRSLTAAQTWHHIVRSNPHLLQRLLRLHRVALAALGIRNDQKAFLRRWIERGDFEDMFWGLHAPRFHPEFKLAPVEEAIAFSIEGFPDGISARYRERPPFGCHRSRFLVALRAYLDRSGTSGERQPRSMFEREVWAIADAAHLTKAPTQ